MNNSFIRGFQTRKMYIVILSINKPFGQMFILIQKHPKNSYTALNSGNHQYKSKYNQYIKLTFNKKTLTRTYIRCQFMMKKLQGIIFLLALHLHRPLQDFTCTSLNNFHINCFFDQMFNLLI
jgi:hypothetical protein